MKNKTINTEYTIQSKKLRINYNISQYFYIVNIKIIIVYC